LKKVFNSHSVSLRKAKKIWALAQTGNGRWGSVRSKTYLF